jgi:hypothetical protein
VEINEPSRGDAAAVLKPIVYAALCVLAALLLWWWLA